MGYVVCKPVNLLGKRQKIGAVIPDAALSEGSARRLLRIGYLVTCTEPAEEVKVPEDTSADAKTLTTEAPAAEALAKAEETSTTEVEASAEALATAEIPTMEAKVSEIKRAAKRKA